MQWLQLFTHMQGPEFLAAYATVWVAFFVVCLIVRHQTDQVSSDTPVIPETDPDPYKIAYLRGGANEVLRLATLELYSQGLLQKEEGKTLRTVQWQRKLDAELPKTLSPFAKQAADFFSVARKPTDIFGSNVASQFVSEFERWDEWIEQEGFRIAPSQQSILNLFSVGSATLFFLAGLTKIVSATLRHLDNIWFAVLMMIIGSVGLLLTRSHRRFNARGRQYLSGVQLINAQYRHAVRDFSVESNTNAVAVGRDQQASMIPLMAVGIFGVAALNGGPFQDFRKMYLRAETTGGGCGSGCAGASAASCGGGESSGGGASCGGASCGGGGGCGGCGGGGCGG
ncbi:MAG: TIGR04222 domain-containing membrane protein [Pirellula sp.]|nr:TIGR04222 domain-containing membrane protein [Pirellula sp.]